MPAKFTELKIPVVNLDERSQTLPKGTKLEVLEQLDEGRSCHSPSESLEPMTDFVQKEENLPNEVSSQVREIPCEEGHCQIGLKRKQEEDPVLEILSDFVAVVTKSLHRKSCRRRVM